jgi:hypothetical protein
VLCAAAPGLRASAGPALSMGGQRGNTLALVASAPVQTSAQASSGRAVHELLHLVRIDLLAGHCLVAGAWVGRGPCQCRGI